MFFEKGVLDKFQKIEFASGRVAIPTSPMPPARASGEILKKGTAVVSAFSSFRHGNAGTEGIRHYYELNAGLLPRLGFFASHEQRIPIDFDGILSSIAPRPLLIIAPKHDRDHSITSVQDIMLTVKDAYEKMHKPGHLTFKEPDTFNHFTDLMQKETADWLGKQKALSEP